MSDERLLGEAAAVFLKLVLPDPKMFMKGKVLPSDVSLSSALPRSTCWLSESLSTSCWIWESFSSVDFLRRFNCLQRFSLILS